MRTIRHSFSILLCCYSVISGAQTTITFQYDYAGNRTDRIIEFKKSAEMLTDTATQSMPLSERMDEMFISIFPNPTKGQLSIDVVNMSREVNSSIEMYNNEGKLIQKLEGILPSNHIDISPYTAGIYYMRVNIGKNVREWKIIKD
jgi:hypothetical protein